MEIAEWSDVSKMKFHKTRCKILQEKPNKTIGFGWFSEFGLILRGADGGAVAGVSQRAAGFAQGNAAVWCRCLQGEQKTTGVVRVRMTGLGKSDWKRLFQGLTGRCRRGCGCFSNPLSVLLQL